MFQDVCVEPSGVDSSLRSPFFEATIERPARHREERYIRLRQLEQTNPELKMAEWKLLPMTIS
jgi:hypothetical protein